MHFIEHFYHILEQYPHRPLFTEIHGENPISFTGAELQNLVAKGRQTLEKHQVKPKDRVVLLAPNSAKWLAADLAILGSGAIVVPLYARQDPSELLQMMADAEPALVLCHPSELYQTIRNDWNQCPVLSLNDFFDRDQAKILPPLSREPSDIVTIIYTSGTSGKAKGVMLSLQNVDFILDKVTSAISELLGERGLGERLFHYLPFCFAGSRIVLWMSLFRAKNIMVSTDLQNLVQEIKTARPQYFLNVPRVLERIKLGVESKIREKAKPVQWLYDKGLEAYMRMAKHSKDLLQDPWLYRLAKKVVFDKIRLQIGPELEVLLCGSAPLSEDVQLWFQMIGLPIYQIYGLTETTAIVTMDLPQQNRPGFVGPVIPGIEVRLSQEEELQVKGPNIFAGYWKNEEATQEAFTQDRWFKTGDQARQDQLGRIKIIGRVKNLLVPTSGHNIAPEPLEQRLVQEIPNAEQALVLGHARPFLVAILTGEIDEVQAQKALDLINETLPHYKRIRKFYATTERFTPENGLLTANMKLRRKVIEAHFAKAIEEMYRS